MNNNFSSNALLDVKYIIEKSQVGQNMMIADLGCGNLGYFVFPLADVVGRHGKVYAVDILRNVLETIDRKIKFEQIRNVETVWSNLEVFKATKIESSSLDRAFLINTLHLSNKKTEILRESARMLKQEALLIIIDWQNIDTPFGPPPEVRVRKESILECGKRNGLEFEGEFLAGQFHYGLIFAKS